MEVSPRLLFFSSTVSKPSCSFPGKPKRSSKQRKKKERGVEKEKRKREQGTEAAGWVQVLLTFAAIVPQISWQTLMALSPCRSLLTFTISCAITAISVWAKGITITVCKNKTHTYTVERWGLWSSASDQLMNKAPLFLTQKSIFAQNGPLLPPSCTLLVYKGQIYNPHIWTFTSHLPFQRNKTRSISWGRWVRVENGNNGI